jgi:hypothetical protein
MSIPSFSQRPELVMQQPEFDHLPETFVRYGLPSNLPNNLPGSLPSNLPSSLPNSMPTPDNSDDDLSISNSLGGESAPLDQFDLSPNVSSDTFIELLVEAWRGEENSKQEANQQAYSQLEQELQEACDQLILAQQKIQIQETTMESLEEHIAKIEEELEAKVSLLAQAELEKEDLRDRLRRQHHHTSQLKAALEKRVETVNTATNAITNNVNSNVISIERSLKSAEKEEESEVAASKLSTTLPVPLPVVESLNSLGDLVAFKSESKSKSESKLNLTTTNLKSESQFEPEVELYFEPSYELNYEVNDQFQLPHLGSSSDGQTTVIEIIQTVPNPEKALNSNQDSNQYPNQDDGRSLRSLADVQTNSFPKLSQIPPLPVPNSPPVLPQSAVIPGNKKALNSLAAVQLPKFPPLRRK